MVGKSTHRGRRSLVLILQLRLVEGGVVGEGRRWAGRPSVETPWAEVVGEEGGGWTCRAEVDARREQRWPRKKNDSGSHAP